MKIERYDFDDFTLTSEVFRQALTEDFLVPKKEMIKVYRVTEMLLFGTEGQYSFEISTNDGFKSSAFFSSAERSVIFNSTGDIPGLNFQLEFDGDFEFSISQAQECEDKITSQFSREDISLFINLGWDKAFLELKKNVEPVMKARVSWYGESQPMPPKCGGYYHVKR